jgi:hypothetical protein
MSKPFKESLRTWIDKNNKDFYVNSMAEYEYYLLNDDDIYIKGDYINIYGTIYQINSKWVCKLELGSNRTPTPIWDIEIKCDTIDFLHEKIKEELSKLDNKLQLCYVENYLMNLLWEETDNSQEPKTDDLSGDANAYWLDGSIPNIPPGILNWWERGCKMKFPGPAPPPLAYYIPIPDVIYKKVKDGTVTRTITEIKCCVDDEIILVKTPRGSIKDGLKAKIVSCRKIRVEKGPGDIDKSIYIDGDELFYYHKDRFISRVEGLDDLLDHFKEILHFEGILIKWKLEKPFKGEMK